MAKNPCGLRRNIHRNGEKFCNNFYFQLTTEEFLNLKSQIGTSSLNGYDGVQKNPYIFAEHVVAMFESDKAKYINNLVIKHISHREKIKSTKAIYFLVEKYIAFFSF